MKLKFSLSLILITSFSFLTFSQIPKNAKKKMSNMIVGKWVQTKMEGYFSDSLQTISSNDTLELKKNGKYIWIKENSREVGKWEIENYTSILNKDKFESDLVFDDFDGTSKGAIGIYELTKTTLVLRTFRMVGPETENNYIDLYFVKLH